MVLKVAAGNFLNRCKSMFDFSRSCRMSEHRIVEERTTVDMAEQGLYNIICSCRVKIWPEDYAFPHQQSPSQHTDTHHLEAIYGTGRHDVFDTDGKTGWIAYAAVHPGKHLMPRHKARP